MNIPGFTAKASLYGESEHYRMAGAHTLADGAIRADGAIQPAQFSARCQDRGTYFCCYYPDSGETRCWIQVE